MELTLKKLIVSTGKKFQKLTLIGRVLKYANSCSHMTVIGYQFPITVSIVPFILYNSSVVVGGGKASCHGLKSPELLLVYKQTYFLL